MKILTKILFSVLNLLLFLLYLIVIIGCRQNSSQEVPQMFPGVYIQKTHIGRPAIQTIFINNEQEYLRFNTTIPSEMSKAFRNIFEQELNELNKGTYIDNFLGLNAESLSDVLATDVLNIDTTTSETTFYQSTNAFTGRKLTDDVMDVMLRLIYGGRDGQQNLSLISDHVDKNDVNFLPYFPYLAPPHTIQESH